MSEKFCVTWNDFKNNVTKSYEKLRKEKDFFDVTLVSEDEVLVEAHKLVLSACSPFFRKVLRSTSHPHPVLCLNGVFSDDLDLVMDYIYQGEVLISQCRLDGFLQLGHRLQLEGLGPDPGGDKQQQRGEQFTNHDERYSEESMMAGKEEQQNIKQETGPGVGEQAGLELMSDDYLHTEDFLHSSEFLDAPGPAPPAYSPCIASGSKQDYDNLLDGLIAQNSDGSFSCRACNKLSARRGNMKTHVEMHVEGFEFTCPQCDKKCKSKSSLSVHMSDYHDPNPQICRLCHNKEFPNKKALKNHNYLTHRPQPAPPPPRLQPAPGPAPPALIPTQAGL